MREIGKIVRWPVEHAVVKSKEHTDNHLQTIDETSKRSLQLMKEELKLNLTAVGFNSRRLEFPFIVYEVHQIINFMIHNHVWLIPCRR